jgi:hypothetical protein
VISDFEWSAKGSSGLSKMPSARLLRAERRAELHMTKS